MSDLLSVSTGLLPDGVRILPLQVHADRRGSLLEFYRESWELGPRPRQWNLVRSEPGVLRGMHLHREHCDLLILLEGHMRLGLVDLRRLGPSAGARCLIDLRGEAPAAVAVPCGVLHGFYFPVPSLHAYSLSIEWDPAEDLDCAFDDPELGLDWGFTREPIRSERDTRAGSLAKVIDALRTRGEFGHGSDPG